MTWTAIAPDALPERLARWLVGSSGVTRIAVDGPPCARPDQLAGTLVTPLRALGRPVAHIVTSTFWRDASVRLEHGHKDVDSYRSWLDADALRREVLDTALTSGSYLPSLRDPITNRSTRDTPRDVEPDLMLLVSGSLLLGRGLPFDRTIHIAVSSAARVRRTPSEQAWTLPAFDAYDAEIQPAEMADAVIKLDDPRHPAIRWT